MDEVQPPRGGTLDRDDEAHAIAAAAGEPAQLAVAA
jgi:hypothetical protein